MPPFLICSCQKHPLRRIFQIWEYTLSFVKVSKSNIVRSEINKSYTSFIHFQIYRYNFFFNFLCLCFTVKYYRIHVYNTRVWVHWSSFFWNSLLFTLKLLCQKEANIRLHIISVNIYHDMNNTIKYCNVLSIH